MPFDPESRRDRSRLAEAVRTSRVRLRPFRENRLAAIRETVGLHYSDEMTKRVPVNWLENAVTIYTMNLAANAPRAMVTSKHPELKRAAADFQPAVNHLIEEIKMGDTIRRIVKDALYGFGIRKCGLAYAGEVEYFGYLHDVGQPYFDRVSPDDWVHDMEAKEWEQVQFCGNRYCMAIEDAQEVFGDHEAFDGQERYGVNDTGDERAWTLSRGMPREDGSLRPMIELWDFWLPYENLVVTVPDRHIGSQPLDVVEWSGPETGPYDMLGFSDVPDQIMPLPPVALWMDMHLLANRLYTKLGRQAERQKSILTGALGDEKKAEKIVRSNDGESVLGVSADVNEMRFGGPDQMNLAFFLSMKNEFDWQAGNLNTLGGLGAQADTASQEQLLASTSSKRMQMMQARTHEFVKNGIRDAAQYMWEDPLIEVPFTKRSAVAPDVSIDAVWTADQREGDYLQYNFDIEPYSMAPTSPAEQLAAITSFLQTIAIPLYPFAQQQGKEIDLDALANIYAGYTRANQLNEVFIDTGEPMHEAAGPVGQPPRQAPVTTRRTERISRSAPSQESQNAQAVQELIKQAGAGIAGQPQGAS